jgi:hypothetical protein
MNKLSVFVAIAGLLGLIGTPLAVATEVVVQNDSFVSGGPAVIVGDFIEGEQAGVRLTSPCAGYIVAVQVAWLEGTPGHGPSLEAAIHIYDGSTFPTPGTELELLEGPVLTPGFINEFRYLDENNTIPLHVPVAAGQRFYVTLEFANPTNVGAGGPSVIRDVDGCQSGKNVLYAIPGGWMNFCLFLQGDLVIRAVIDCPGPTGACCHADGTCTSGVEQHECQAFGDVWTQGATCAQVTCNPRGACCRSGGCLQLVSPAQCSAIGGTYAGNATNCDDQVCVAGACCIAATGECLQVFEFQCQALGGSFLGHGVSCTPNPCPQPSGACCFGSICIPGQTLAQCSSAGGEWAGAGTNCSDNNGNGLPDACESCAGQELADANCDGVVNAFDIDAFVLALTNQAAWQAQYGSGGLGCDIMCVIDCNADGTINSFDIDPFVQILTGGKAR